MLGQFSTGDLLFMFIDSPWRLRITSRFHLNFGLIIQLA